MESIEFAIVGFTFFLMLFSLFELGRLASAESALHYGTSVAVRYAAVHSAASPASTAAIQAQFASAVQPILGSSAPAPSVTYAPNHDPGSMVTVAATYPWSPVSLPGSFASVTLSARSSLAVVH